MIYLYFLPDPRQKRKKRIENNFSHKGQKPTPDRESCALFQQPAVLTSCTPHSKHLFSSTGSGVWQYRHTGHLPRTPKENGTDEAQETAATEPKVRNCIFHLRSLTHTVFILTSDNTCKLLSK